MSEFILNQGLGHELEMAIGRTGGVTADVQWLRTGSNFENVILLARNRAQLVLLEEAKPKMIDPIVHIDHSVRPAYPDFLDSEYINKPEFVALEKTGPAKFDASKLRQWFHPKQKRCVVRGEIIHEILVKEELIPSCLGFADLLGIQSKGIEFYRANFKGQAVFGWRSVVPGRVDNLRVPCLVEGGGEVALRWYWLVSDWGAASPALRFANLFVSLPESCSGRVFV